MAGVDVPPVFKDLPVKVQTSKLVIRKDIFSQLQEATKNVLLPEPRLRGLCHVLRLTLPRYHGSNSRHLVEQFLECLLKNHPSSAGQLIATVLEVSREHRPLFITKNLARTCLTALSWSCKVASQVFVNKGDLKPDKMRDLVEAQANLLLSVVSACDATLNKKARRKMNYLWKQVTPEAYLEVLATLESSCPVLLSWCFLIGYLDTQKLRELIHSHKAKFLEVFRTAVLGSKTPAPTHVLEQSRSLLRHVTHDDFKGQLLPALQKAMLRNPEIIMESVAHVMQGVSLELSPYLGDLGKSIAQHLIAKDEACRQGAVLALRHLAKQCGSQEALEVLLSHLVEVLNGSEGKLSTTEQRLGVLMGFGEVSCHVVTGASHVQKLSEAALKHLLQVLKSEVHEGTLLLTLKVMSKWCSRFTEDVPAFLVEGFQTGMGLKSSTSAVRYGYLQCMLSAFHGVPGPGVEPLVGLLLKAVERALSQPSQPSPVCEGLAAACLLLRLQASSPALENKVKATVSQLLDPQKQPFFADKFLQTASEDTYLLVLQLITRMILDHPDSSLANLKPFALPLLRALSHSAHPVRQSAQSTVKKLVSVLGGTSLACFLLREFPEFVETHLKEKVEDAEATEAKVLSEALVTICSGSNLDAKDVEDLALESLLPAHLPVFASRYPKLWRRILELLKLDLKAPVDPSRALPLVLGKKVLTPELKGAVRTLVALLPADTLPAVVSEVLGVLGQSELRTVTAEEHAIYTTPEGTLFNKAVLSSVVEATTESKNIKRESKVYSYKEQMEEIELKKELEAKKKSKVQEPELSKKQKEAMEAQLQKEHAVRLRIRKLAESVERALQLLGAALSAPAPTVCLHGAPLFPEVVQALTSLFSSRLAAPYVVQAFLGLKDVLFPPDLRHFGQWVGFLTLRLAGPCCPLDPRWTQEDLEECTQRVVGRLHDLTCGGSRRLASPAFCFAFPLLRLVLASPDSGDQLVTQCLQVLSAHSFMRAREPLSLDNPKNLPVEKMLEAIVSLLGRTTGRIQRLAQKVAVDVCFSISGLEGCSRAEVAEIKVLLSALYCPELVVRETALQCLLMLQLVLPTKEKDPSNALELASRVWVAKFDSKEEIQALAEKLWRELLLEPEPAMASRLLGDVGHPHAEVRVAAAGALRALVAAFPDCFQEVLLRLMETYEKYLQRPEPIRDSFGRVLVESPPDVWEPRSGVGVALGQLASLVPTACVAQVMQFFVPLALSDPRPQVHKAMLDAAVALIDFHGNGAVHLLLPLFEKFLDEAPDDVSYDQVRQSVVILMGTLARHLDKEDHRVKPIVKKLIDTLATPSQQVQEAVASCLPPLIPAIKEEAPALVQKLLTQLLNSDQYGERRGAAYGLAGLVRGLGILSLKQLDIMNTLTEAVQDKKNARRKEGALLAFEMLCSVLGRLFEPYVVHVLPHLLLCFGDSNQYVREATDNTAKAVMSKLTAHGVKLTLPSLLAGLENDQWRTKSGSVELLGAMAFCAPKQLSSCLPSIVPKLMEVLSDSHVKVQRAGAQALQNIGSVIKNPEIQAIVPVLLEALQDPAGKTSGCLATLLHTKFVHFIDAPSLALIMPVVQRAFQDRSTETRKMAAQIIGNMYSLTDHKDLAPYLPAIIPGLKQSLLDPVPEVRSVSSRALGAMIKGMGETCFEDLIPWLMQTLTSEASPVDRSGAAQGLSEVLGGLGVEKLQTLMPEIISTAERTDIAPHVKDGYVMMFIYLPSVFQKEFTPYISQIINPILKALADENEFVRETALRAGQRMVSMYAETAMTLLLPQLEKGLFDDNWRIRYSSVQLLGDLLYKISGVTGKMSTETADEDDNFGTEQSHKAILIALGEERRNRVLAGLYMGRLDTSLMVRQASLHVWKVVVTNTPRTLREILPTLFSLLLGFLASSSYDKQQVAARTLGDLVRKLGERVLPEIVPILEQGLDSPLPDQRQGVCVGLSEILASTSRDMVLTFLDSLVPTVRRALCDPLREVRVAAARTFDNLHSTVGSRALDDILSPLLLQLGNSELAENTLDGLRQVMAIKSRVVLPYLIPQLTTPPVNTKALSHLSAVAGESLSRHLPKILPALLTSFSAAIDTPKQQEELEYCQAVVLSVGDEAGVRTVVEQLLEGARQRAQRRGAVALLCAFCSHTKAPLGPHVPQLLRELLRLFTDTDRHVLQLAGEALAAVTKTLDTNQQIEYVADVRQAIRFAVSDLKGQEHLPGFCQEKGISPILPIFREAILIGVPELKEQAAQGLGEVIRLTDPASLKQSVISITGPLIRILGDRFSFGVKVAVLETLALLLAKVGVQLKPFLPQLQTTFLKALNDGNRQVRLKASVALSHLIVIHTRCDPVFQELHNSVKSQDDVAVRETMLYALHRVVAAAGNKMSDLMRRSVTITVSSYLSSSEDGCRTAAAGCLGSLCRWLPPDELAAFARDYLLNDDPSEDWTLRHGCSVTLSVALKQAPERILTEEWRERVVKTLVKYMTADRVPIVIGGVRGTSYFLHHALANNEEVPQLLLTTFAKCLNHANNEVKQLVAQSVQWLSRGTQEPGRGLASSQLLRSLVPQLVNGTKEKNSMVRANSEYALVSLLRLRTSTQGLDECLEVLDPGARESLQDVYTKVLRKVVSQPEPREEDLDDGILS
ncbi:eIF-2-alpha kinase activator GCN1 [Ixodes scapularis]|uniref:eIF-2-alpha kinase activator GCN1 n=1 Tax=Ixodes scapularis TaxID=6945 RepID=UPI001C391292|nr:eIF-2-alpha kinase activator GCN1 [Ixodes scapularis]